MKSESPQLSASQLCAPSRADDSDLLERIANGEERALGELYDVYAPSLYRVLLAILDSPEDAEDALQEVFLRVAKGQMKRVRDVRAYLHTCARHIALDALRRRKHEYSCDDEIGEIAAPATKTETPTDWHALLRHLPVEQREVIALKVWEEMTFEQIAKIVKTSPNTAASRYRYGIEKLRNLWRQSIEVEDE